MLPDERSSHVRVWSEQWPTTANISAAAPPRNTSTSGSASSIWRSTKGRQISFASVITQILILDIVFSLDSVITAVGMVDDVGVMIAAVVVAIGIMLVSAGAIGRFVDRHPTVKMLALSFLLLIGVTLIAEGFGQHVSKGYIYFAMGFSVFVEMLNLKLRSKQAKQKPVELHQPYR